MQMLAAGGVPILTDGVRGPDVDNPKGYLEYEAVKASARDTGWFAEAPGRAVKVIHALVPRLPEGPELRVLFVQRDMDEVLQSQARMLAREGRAASAGGSPDDAVLARVFAEQVREALAFLAARPRTAVLRLWHHELLASPAEQAARIDAFLGGGLDTQRMAACVDPDLHRQRARRQPSDLIR
jgi:hypothetical protein